MTDETITGARLLARSLKQQGVNHMFGVVGFPITEFATECQNEGIQYLGMRNEQAASYAAQAAGYLTGRPQGCTTVPGPGVINAMSGLANAQKNCWPMIHIGGASAMRQNGMGAFQEENHIELVRPVTKYAHSVEDATRIPYYVEQAIRHSLHGRPGASFLDLPDDILLAKVNVSDVASAAHRRRTDEDDGSKRERGCRLGSGEIS